MDAINKTSQEYRAKVAAQIFARTDSSNLHYVLMKPSDYDQIAL